MSAFWVRTDIKKKERFFRFWSKNGLRDEMALLPLLTQSRYPTVCPRVHNISAIGYRALLLQSASIGMKALVMPKSTTPLASNWRWRARGRDLRRFDRRRGGAYEFAALGDTMNFGARLVAAAKAVEFMMSEAVWKEVSGEVPAAPRKLEFKGYTQPVTAYAARVKPE